MEILVQGFLRELHLFLLRLIFLEQIEIFMDSSSHFLIDVLQQSLEQGNRLGFDLFIDQRVLSQRSDGGNSNSVCVQHESVN